MCITQSVTDVYIFMLKCAKEQLLTLRAEQRVLNLELLSDK